MPTQPQRNNAPCNDDELLDFKLQQAREELQRLKSRRQQVNSQREQIIDQLQKENKSARQALETRMNTRPSHSLLMRQLKKRHLAENGGRMLPSLYVLKQETLWMSNMLYAFTVLPKQRAIVERHHEGMERYLAKERVRIFMKLDDANQQTLKQVTMAAESYSTGYDSYQHQLDELRGKIQECSSQLQEKQDDSTSLGCSDTEHSLSEMYSLSEISFEDESDEDASQGESSIGSRFVDFFQANGIRERVSTFRAAQPSVVH